MVGKREYCDLCLNSDTIDPLTVKDRISWSVSLGYKYQAISHYVDELHVQSKDRCDRLICERNQCILGVKDFAWPCSSAKTVLVFNRLLYCYYQ